MHTIRVCVQIRMPLFSYFVVMGLTLTLALIYISDRIEPARLAGSNVSDRRRRQAVQARAGTLSLHDHRNEFRGCLQSGVRACGRRAEAHPSR